MRRLGLLEFRRRGTPHSAAPSRGVGEAVAVAGSRQREDGCRRDSGGCCTDGGRGTVDVRWRLGLHDGGLRRAFMVAAPPVEHVPSRASTLLGPAWFGPQKAKPTLPNPSASSQRAREMVRTLSPPTENECLISFAGAARCVSVRRGSLRSGAQRRSGAASVADSTPASPRYWLSADLVITGRHVDAPISRANSSTT